MEDELTSSFAGGGNGSATLHNGSDYDLECFVSTTEYIPGA